MSIGMPIAAYAKYIPAYRLSRDTVNASIRPEVARPRQLGWRAVAGHDEDTTTMAVAAVRALPSNRATANWLYLSSSALAVQDLTNASIVATASGLHAQTCPLDLSGLRAGMSGMLAAASTGGIAVASDARTGAPGSALEIEGGDAAAAFLFAETPDPVAEIIDSASQELTLNDSWRQPGDPFPSTWEERFLIDAYTHATNSLVTDLLQRNGQLTPTFTVVASPSQKFAQSTARRFSPDERGTVQGNHAGTVGYCGSAEAGTLLAQALDVAKAGDTILALSVVGGIDAVLVRVLRDGRETDGPAVEHPRIDIPYVRFLTWRGLLDRESARRPERARTSVPAAFRSALWKHAVSGARCECGNVQLPQERVCGECGRLDSSTPYSVADRLGTVQSAATDMLSDSPAAQAIAAVVDFDGGGRMSVELTDTDGIDIGPGSRVSLTFRRTSTIRGLPNYFWRARPVRREAV